jgi:hypothetical protein
MALLGGRLRGEGHGKSGYGHVVQCLWAMLWISVFFGPWIGVGEDGQSGGGMLPLLGSSAVAIDD